LDYDAIIHDGFASSKESLFVYRSFFRVFLP
jgi:hypothetical protein